MNPDKKIVIAMFPEWAAMNSTITLARALSSRGFEVTYVGPPPFKAYIESQGLRYRVFDIKSFSDQLLALHLDNELKKTEPGRPKPGKIQGYRLAVRWRAKTRQDIQQILTELFSKDRPDLVLLDPFLEDFFVPFRRLHIPIIHLNFTLMSPFTTRVPPAYTGIVPGKKSTGLARLRNLLAWAWILSKQWARRAGKYVILRFCFGLSPIPSLKKDAAQYGMRLESTEIHARLPLPELVMCPQEFEFPHFPRSSSRCYAGTGVDVRRQQAPFDWKNIDTTRPIIYCTLGSYAREWKHRRRLYRSVVAAMQHRPGWHLILQVPEGEDPAGFSPLPAHITLAGWVPQMDILSRASVIICHSGLATIREAILCGVPMILFPCGRDQPGNAARAVFHHLGVKGNIGRVTPQVIDRLIDRVCGDEVIRQALGNMQHIFRDQVLCRKGVEFIEEILNKRG